MRYSFEAIANAVAIVAIAGVVVCAALLLDGCSQKQVDSAAQVVQVACGFDAALQPIIVTLASDVGGQVAALATKDQQLVHPAVKAACAAAGGVAQALVVKPVS